MALQHLRASTADKRPTPAAMADGQLAMNTNLASPGLFFKDSNGDLVKVGPVHVGTTAPNATPGAGGQAGNSKGELWLDTTGSDYSLKTWDGTAFREIVVTSTMIKDGTIVNADVNASAAIAGTKISPNFGSQNVLTTGTATAASLIPTGSSVPANGVYLPEANEVGISTDDSERARIDSSGRLLVGTSSALNVSGSAGFEGLQIAATGTASSVSSSRFTNDSLGGFYTFAKSRGATVGANTIVQSADTIGSLRFTAADGSSYIEAARITAAVDGTPGANDMPGRLVFSTTADGASSPTERMRISNDGVISTSALRQTTLTSGSDDGVAMFGPVVAISRSLSAPLLLRRRSSDGAITIFYRDTTQVGNISVTTTATAYNTSSDYRLKENVVPLTGAIDRVNDLQVHRFNFIADPDKTVDGFIAHEAQAVVPECVTGTKDAVDDDGTPVYQGIDQSKLVPLLTAALQEALAEIESLKARVTALEP